ncbi:MAG: hypothetical protein WAW63_00535 [Candidatus Saccharimonadales bacterium]|nr:PilN domain-containing protein [Candidatus Saccharimonas sp.]
MVQLNLLPDIKLEFVKARRTKYLMTFISLVVGGISLAVFLFAFFFVNVVQKKSLSDLDGDIKTYHTKLKGFKSLDKILTVQSQLNTLTKLHVQKPVATRLLSYISQVTPAQASLDKLDIDFAVQTISISGKADNLDTVSIYTDTLKGTRYRQSKPAASLEQGKDLCPNLDGEQTIIPENTVVDSEGNCVSAKRAFSEVVLKSFKRDEKGANFTITLKYDPALFDVSYDTNLLVPTSTPTNEGNLFGGEN